MSLGRALVALGTLFELGERVSARRAAAGAVGKPGPRGMTATLHHAAGIEDRIALIVPAIQRGADDPAVIDFATRAVTGKCGVSSAGKTAWCVPEGDKWGECVAVFAAIRNNVRYTSDPVDKDLYKAARRTLEMGGGDCDCIVIALGACLRAIGFEQHVRVIESRDSPVPGEYDHIYNKVLADKTWYALDASTAHPPGWQPSESQVVRYKDFLVP